jgi:hypothetical protein
MVSGAAEVPTRTWDVIQWGDTTSTAAGRGSAWPSAVSWGPRRPGSSAKVGAPCETNRVGRRVIRISPIAVATNCGGMEWTLLNPNEKINMIAKD